MLHRTAKLTPFGRRLLVERILVEGWAPAIAAETVAPPAMHLLELDRQFVVIPQTTSGGVSERLSSWDVAVGARDEGAREHLEEVGEVDPRRAAQANDKEALVQGRDEQLVLGDRLH